MSITGPGSITAANVAAQTNMMNQLNTLGQELAADRRRRPIPASVASRRGAGAQRAAFGDQRL